MFQLLVAYGFTLHPSPNSLGEPPPPIPLPGNTNAMPPPTAMPPAPNNANPVPAPRLCRPHRPLRVNSHEALTPKASRSIDWCYAYADKSLDDFHQLRAAAEAGEIDVAGEDATRA